MGNGLNKISSATLHTLMVAPALFALLILFVVIGRFILEL